MNSPPRLYSARLVFILSALISPALGGVLVAINLARLGRRRAALTAACAGIVVAAFPSAASVIYDERIVLATMIIANLAAGSLASAYTLRLQENTTHERAPFLPATVLGLILVTAFHFVVESATGMLQYEIEYRQAVREQNLGVAAYRRGDDLRAQHHFEKALCYFPGSPDLRFNLALTHINLGDRAAARRSLRRVLHVTHGDDEFRVLNRKTRKLLDDLDTEQQKTP